MKVIYPFARVSLGVLKLSLGNNLPEATASESLDISYARAVNIQPPSLRRDHEVTVRPPSESASLENVIDDRSIARERYKNKPPVNAGRPAAAALVVTAN